jgi:hypothetical protein
MGSPEILYPVRRGPATTVSNNVTEVKKEKVAPKVVKSAPKSIPKTLTTSTYVPVESTEER